MRSRLVGSLALGAALVLGGCDGDEPVADETTDAQVSTASGSEPTTADAAPTTDDVDPATGEPEPSPTEEASAADETSPDAEPPAAAPAAPGLPRTPEEYTDAWVRAWGLGDDDEMAAYADRYVHSQYSGTAGGGTWVRQESGPYEDGLVFVTYEDSQSGAGLFLLVAPHLVEIGAQHGLISVAQMPPDSGAPGLGGGPADDPITPGGLTTDLGEYADIWVRAWGAGDDETAEAYGNADAMYLFAIDSRGGTDWARVGVSGTEVRYRDGGSNTLVLVLDSDRVAAGATDGVVMAYYE